MSPDELGRAKRFRFDRDRERFVSGRGAVRDILARYVNQDPARLRLETGPNGKPELSFPPLAFNISHAGPVFVLAIDTAGPVGIDVELPKPVADLDSLAATVFTEREQGEFRGVPQHDRLRAFYHAWTIKEAVLKYLGHGFSTPPTAVHLDFNERPTPALVRVSTHGTGCPSRPGSSARSVWARPVEITGALSVAPWFQPVRTSRE